MAVQLDFDSEIRGERAWYVVHTYSGYENKVKANLESKIASQGLGDEIFNVMVPLEETEELDRQGKKKMAKVFPGYVLVEMVVNNRSWYVVRNTQGVTGFVGSEKEPIPLSPEEVERIMASQGQTAPDPFKSGDEVRIIGGWYEGQSGTVESVEGNRVKVTVGGAKLDLELKEVEKK